MTTKTIGPSGDYSSISLWLSSCPNVDRVSAADPWIGALQTAGSPFTLTSGITFSGFTTNSTYYIGLTTDTGASFIDNASASSNALRANSSNGVIVQTSTAWVDLFTSSSAFVKVSKLQFAVTNTTGTAFVTTSTGVFQIDKCIIETKASTSSACVVFANTGARISNSLVINRRSSSPGPILKGSTWSAYNCTLVSTAAAAANAFYVTSSGPTAKNCAIFNCTALLTGGGSVSYTTCATDIASPPSGVTGSLTYSSQFENTTDGSHDFRLKTGNSLTDVGTTESTYAANDIINTSRPQGSAYDIGAWEAPSTGYTITAGQGTYTLTGQAAGVRTTRTMPAAYGTYTLTGKAATLTKETPGAFTMPAAYGTYTITGSNALSDYAMNASCGTYNLSGQAVSFTRTYPASYTITAAYGTYELIGRRALLNWSAHPIVTTHQSKITIGTKIGL